MDAVAVNVRSDEAAVTMRQHAGREAEREGDAFRHVTKAWVIGGRAGDGGDLDRLLARGIPCGVQILVAGVTDRTSVKLPVESEVRRLHVLAIAGQSILISPEPYCSHSSMTLQLNRCN